MTDLALADLSFCLISCTAVSACLSSKESVWVQMQDEQIAGNCKAVGRPQRLQGEAEVYLLVVQVETDASDLLRLGKELSAGNGKDVLPVVQSNKLLDEGLSLA